MSANFWGEPIHVYTRAQAIADGVLVDVTGPARLAGWRRFPVAVNATVAAFLGLLDGLAEDVAQPLASDELGAAKRLHRALELCLEAARRAGGESDRATLTLLRGAERLRVVVHCGPGDNAEPVITICPPEDL